MFILTSWIRRPYILWLLQWNNCAQLHQPLTCQLLIAARFQLCSWCPRRRRLAHALGPPHGRIPARPQGSTLNKPLTAQLEHCCKRLINRFLQLSKMLLASVDLGCSEEARTRTALVLTRKQTLIRCYFQVLTVVAMLSGDGGKVPPNETALYP